MVTFLDGLLSLHDRVNAITRQAAAGAGLGGDERHALGSRLLDELTLIHGTEVPAFIEHQSDEGPYEENSGELFKGLAISLLGAYAEVLTSLMGYTLEESRSYLDGIAALYR